MKSRTVIDATSMVTPTAVLLFPIPALATPTTQYTTSYETQYTDIYTSPVVEDVNTYLTELIAKMQGGAALSDLTFAVPFADTSVQSAILADEGLLTANGAVSFVGPTILTDSTGLVSTNSVTGSPVPVSSDVFSVTTLYVGPQTIYIGEDQSQPFFIPAGGYDFDTVITTSITQEIPTTTTNTYLTADVYDLVGLPVQTASNVPEPSSLTVLAAALIGLAIIRKRACAPLRIISTSST